ncbi:MAG: hypothetical protein K6G12_00690 [Lachnospiraceae bacterium]|nr:hypothetical protein [Lachnospiraceae bacterium]
MRKKGRFTAEKLHIDSQPRTIQLKFYAEQAGYIADPDASVADEKKRQVKILRDVLQRMKKSFRPDEFLVWGIVHDSCETGDGFFLPSAEKPHVHIYIIPYKSRWRVGRYFKILKVTLREQDEEMWKHAVDVISDRHEAALYATHDSKNAIQEGKHHYPVIDVITNDMDTYVTLRGDGQQAQKRFSQADWEKVYRDAYAHGYGLGAWKHFYDTLPNSAKERKTKIQLAREYYERGIDKHIAEDNCCTRTCIFIQGERNLGKSYATKYAITQMYGDSNLDITDGGTGQFDDIDPSYKAIFLNDFTLPAKSLRSMADDQIVKVYRRNNSNPYLAAELLVVTANTSFVEWAKECGMKTSELVEGGEPDEKIIKATESYLALKSRFFICEVRQNKQGNYKLYNISTPERGNEPKLQQKEKTFKQFRELFDSCISSYHPSLYYIRPEDLNSDFEDPEPDDLDKEVFK